MSTSPTETRTKLSSRAPAFTSILDSGAGGVGSWVNGQFYVPVAIPVTAFLEPTSMPTPTEDHKGDAQQAEKQEFKLGDFRSRLFQRAKTQASKPAPKIISLEKSCPVRQCSACQASSSSDAYSSADSEQCKECQEKEEEKSWEELRKGLMVPEIPAKHAAAFTKVEPSKPEPDDPDLLPVKHTFIHFPDTDGPSSVGQQWSSTPPVMMRCDHHTKYPNMEAAHMAGTCHPCFYNLKKADGCRKGADCEFCHLCPQGSVQKKRKERVKALKEQELLEKEAKQKACQSRRRAGGPRT